MFVHLPATTRATAHKLILRNHHGHFRPHSGIHARFITATATADPRLLNNEPANSLIVLMNQVSLQIMLDWKEDRQRWETQRKEDRQSWENQRKEDRSHWEIQQKEFENERRNFHTIDKNQSVMIAELKKEALGLLEKKVRFEQNFNVRGGLERICYQAVLEKRIKALIGVQLRLDALAMTPEFQKIYLREIEARGLIKPDVERCRRHIYHELSKHAHGNDGVIQVRHADFTVNEAAAVLSYYKMQDNWKDCIKWEEHIVEKSNEKAGKDGPGEK